MGFERFEDGTPAFLAGIGRFELLSLSELDALHRMVGEFIDSHGEPTDDEIRLAAEIAEEIERRRA